MVEQTNPPVLDQPVDPTQSQILKQQAALDALKAGQSTDAPQTQTPKSNAPPPPSTKADPVSVLLYRISELEHMVETLARATIAGGKHRIEDLVEWLESRL